MSQNLESLNVCFLCGADRIVSLDVGANICECRACGYIFDNPRPTVESLIAFYSQPTKYDSWLAEEKARDKLWERRLNRLLPVRKPGSLLDVGAGIGQFLDIARPHFTEVYGTEVSESAIEIARERYGLDLFRGEIGGINFGSLLFDNITIFHVLEHVPNPRLVVEKCATLLRSGGLLVIAVPNDLYTFRGGHFLRSFAVRNLQVASKLGLPKLVLDGSIPEIHLSHFTPGVLKRLIRQSGFSVVASGLDPYYASTGLAKWKHRAFYGCCWILEMALRVNLYDTTMVIAKKK